MAESVASLWRTIEENLAVHAPTVLPTLNPPATDADLDRLEALLGHALPTDVRMSYRIHNGQDDPSRLELLCDAGTLLAVDDVITTWQMITQIDRDLGPSESGIEWWNPAYLPISDFEGDHVCVNLLPDSHGEILWHVHDNGIEHDCFPSYSDWLAHVADVLSNERFENDEGYLNFWIEP